MLFRSLLTDKGRALREPASAVPACLVEQTGLKLEDVIRLQREITALREAMAAAQHPAPGAPAG